MKHAPFRVGFIWLALTAALGAGFPIGAHLSFVMGFGFALSPGFASFVQTHGHVQLIGWAGLFVMGISLHFVPRLAGVPMARPHWVNRILWLMGIGLALRVVSHSAVPYLTGNPTFSPAVWLGACTGLLEATGIWHYVYLLFLSIRREPDHRVRSVLLAIRPYMGMMLTGWVLYACLNLFLLVDMALKKSVVVDVAWNQVGIESFIGLVLLPVTFVFSVRMFPLYLRLAVPNWSVRRVAHIYLVGLVLRVLPMMPLLRQSAPQVMLYLSHIGMALRGGVILWFVWQFDLLTRRKAPWIVHRKLPPCPERRAARPGLTDHGAFGHFERLVYAAYVWLVASAASELISGLTGLCGGSWFVGHAAIRHMYLAGFINLLIFGMAARMLPGFLQKRRIASPALVNATFWLGNAAALCRVSLFVIPPSLSDILPGLQSAARFAFAISGLIGIVAVLCLAMNLWRTAKRV